jgi:hypothetical protein
MKVRYQQEVQNKDNGVYKKVIQHSQNWRSRQMVV